jgi:uncharacterized protein (TIGR03437 family)
MAFKKLVQVAAVLAVLLTLPSARSQSASGVHIYTTFPGASFSVDGQNFLGSADLIWPAGSKHTVTSYSQQFSTPGTQLVYKGWVTNLNPATQPSVMQPITADPGLKWIQLVFETWYGIIIDLADCGDTTRTCSVAGNVAIRPCPTGTVCTPDGWYIADRRAEAYYKEGSVVSARALPASGFVFTGWAPVTNYTGTPSPPTAFDITFSMNAPTQLSPMFRPANAVSTSVNVTADPPQAKVYLDHTPYTPPVTLDWGWNTVHSLSADPSILVAGVSYVFDSWSDGGAINHDIRVPNNSGSIDLKAKFVPAYLIGFITSPPGLQLSIDGRQNWASYDFAWTPGSAHTIAAPATQTDSKGRKFKFVSWSNGKPASFTYTAGAAPGNDHFTAVYQQVSQTTVTSVPPGIPMQVDGASCTTPCAIEKDVGSTATLAVAPVRVIDDASRLVFQGWGDSADTSRTVVLGGDPRVYTAIFGTQNKLALAATPPEGATLALDPVSADGFYDAGTQVAITVKLVLGFRFHSWSGDISGTSSGAAVTMDAPRSATLLLDRVPAIAPAGIRNAAAPAVVPQRGVAPGSLISIFGGSLAADLAAGPRSPLAQTIAGVTVRVDGTFLPLLFVSPGQINAQLPAATTPGAHKLIVRWEGHPETQVDVQVARNAPGLFSTGPADQPVGAFLHAEGDEVSVARPARAGEVLTILGTGLGPYVSAPPDGFLFDEDSGYTLADTVTVMVGDTPLDALYAGRSGTAVGVDAVRFQLPASLPDGASVPVKIVVSGQESNLVMLPVLRQE